MVASITVGSICEGTEAAAAPGVAADTSPAGVNAATASRTPYSRRAIPRAAREGGAEQGKFGRERRFDVTGIMTRYVRMRVILGQFGKGA